MTLTEAHWYAFNAIKCWLSTTIQLAGENTTTSVCTPYHTFVTNAQSESEVKQVINDFYDYFYTNINIHNVNIFEVIDEIDSEYASFDFKSIINKLKLDSAKSTAFRTLTIYVFQLIISLREKLELKQFDDPVKNVCVSCYLSKS